MGEMQIQNVQVLISEQTKALEEQDFSLESSKLLTIAQGRGGSTNAICNKVIKHD
jgi:hypothetical protein